MRLSVWNFEVKLTNFWGYVKITAPHLLVNTKKKFHQVISNSSYADCLYLTSLYYYCITFWLISTSQYAQIYFLYFVFIFIIIRDIFQTVFVAKTKMRKKKKQIWNSYWCKRLLINKQASWELKKMSFNQNVIAELSFWGSWVVNKSLKGGLGHVLDLRVYWQAACNKYWRWNTKGPARYLIH